MISVALRTPTKAHEGDCLAFLEACKRTGSAMAGTAGLERMSYADWLTKIAKSQAGVNLPADRVPATTFLGYHDAELVGIIDIRHTLNAFLAHAGGHIGYMVHPDKRRLGFASAMLHEALKYAYQTLKIERVLVTCSPDNLGSKRTILNNHGVYENTVEDALLGTVERYWIDLKGRF
ncbi:MAG: GNAT family N-acetyltransferase [Acholeplasmatales bacterium]|nr:MAG: GNAT family N-acetyltransferase [Acholeplasmatales bacterium]